MAASGSSLKIRQYVYKDPNNRNRRRKRNEKTARTKSTQQDSLAQQMMLTYNPNEPYAAALDIMRADPQVGYEYWTPPHYQTAKKVKSAKGARTSVLPYANSPGAVMSSDSILLSSPHAKDQDEKSQSEPSWWHEHERGAKIDNMKASSLHAPQEIYQTPFRENDEMRTATPQTNYIPQFPSLMADDYSNSILDTEYIRLTSDDPMQVFRWLLNSYQLLEEEQSQRAEHAQEFRGLGVEPLGPRPLYTQPAVLEQGSNDQVGSSSSRPTSQIPSELIGKSQPSTSISSSISKSYSMPHTKIHDDHPRVVDDSQVSPHPADYTGNLVWLSPMVPLRVPKRERGQEDEEFSTRIGQHSSPSVQASSLPREERDASTSGHPLTWYPTTEGSVRLQDTYSTTEKPRDKGFISAGICNGVVDIQGQPVIEHSRLPKRKRDMVEDADFNIRFTQLSDKRKTKRQKANAGDTPTTKNTSLATLSTTYSVSSSYPSVTQRTEKTVQDPISMTYLPQFPVLVPPGVLASPSLSLKVPTRFGSAMGYSSHEGTSMPIHMDVLFGTSQVEQPQVESFQDLERKGDMEVTDEPNAETQRKHPRESYRESLTKRRETASLDDILEALSTNVPEYSSLASYFPFPSQVVRTDDELSDTALLWATPVERDGLPTIGRLPPDVREDHGIGSYNAVVRQTEVQPQDSTIAQTPTETPREQDLSDQSLEWSHWEENLSGESNIDTGQPEGISEEEFLRFLEDLDMYSRLQESAV